MATLTSQSDPSGILAQSGINITPTLTPTSVGNNTSSNSNPVNPGVNIMNDPTKWGISTSALSNASSYLFNQGGSTTPSGTNTSSSGNVGPSALAKPDAKPGDPWYMVKQSDVTPTLTAFLNNLPTPQPFRPSSSATFPTNVAGVSALTSAVNPTPASTNPQGTQIQNTTDFINKLNSFTGTNISTDLIQAGVNAGYSLSEATDMVNNRVTNNAAKQEQLATAAQERSDELAQNNATYAALRSRLQQNKMQAVNAENARANAAGFTPGKGTTEGGPGAISALYDQLDVQLQAQADSAIAAANAGNDKLALSIQQNMQTTYANGLKDIQSRALQEATQRRQSEQLQQQIQNQSLTQARDMLVNMTPTNADTYAAMPADFNTLNDIQKNQLQTNSPEYQLLIKGGLTPSAAYSMLREASTNPSYKQQKLNIDLLNAQIKAESLGTWSLQYDPSSGKSYYVNNKTMQTRPFNAPNVSVNGIADSNHPEWAGAVNNIISSMKNPSTTAKTTLSQTVDSALVQGKNDEAKQAIANAALKTLPSVDQTTYSSLSILNNISEGLSGFLGSLSPQDQPGYVAGTVANFLNKFGTTNNQSVSALKYLSEHQSVIYTALLAGKGFLRSTQGLDKMSDMFPQSTDSVKLAMTKVRALEETASEVQSGILKQVLTPENYSAIFENSGQQATSGKTSGGIGWTIVQ